MAILLTILKIIGILLLVLLGTAVILAALVIFVPVRYHIKICRREGDKAPLAAEVKITWLLHIVNAAFSYPEAAYIRVRLFCFTLFRSDKGRTRGQNSEKENSGGRQAKKPAETKEPENAIEKEQPGTEAAKPAVPENTEKASSPGGQDKRPGDHQADSRETGREERQKQEETAEEDSGIEPEETGFAGIKKLREFFSRLLSIIKNIRYTICQICDKIKDIVNNIQYYINILKSDVFQRTWTLCSGQVRAVLGSIRPRKITGKLLIGTGDPASTGQVLAIYGILYPMIGNRIEVAPDFEQKTLEGELFIKGKITVFRFLKTGWTVYFNRDLRRLLKLLKREAA